MKNFNLLMILLSTALVLGCGQVKFHPDVAAAKQQTAQSLPSPLPEAPTCEIDDSDYELSAQVLSFEVLSSNNVAFGFDLASKFFRAFDINFKATSAQIFLTMDLVDTLQPKYAIAEVEGFAKSKENQFNFEVNIYQFSTDIGHYSKTPLATLSHDGLNDSFTKVKQRLASLGQTWKSRVTAASDSQHAVIPAGSLAGIKVGDTFNLYNVQNVWKGAPCASELVISQKTTDTPIAIGQAIQVDVNATVLSLSEVSTDTPLKSGALVEIRKLRAFGKNVRSLGQSIRIGPMVGGKLVFGTDTSIDLSTYISNQIRPIVEVGGFYIRRQ